MINLVIVEDHALLQDTLAKSLRAEKDITVAACIDDADDAPALVAALKPDLVLMDVVTGKEAAGKGSFSPLKKANGIAVAARIHRDQPDVKIIIITAYPEVSFIEQAKEAGAQGFVYKNAGASSLISVIRSVMDGYTNYPLAPAAQMPATCALTPDELRVLRLVCQAKSRKEIAADIGVSESTVKAHIAEILAKTGFDTIWKLAIYAVQNGFIVPGSEG
ncbi:response regulator transcription factor [Leadbettera azotonutricia]|uniref:Response regulator, NarL-family n=1 Tax=Leadbettera azotonutricia (strain ATCC BAA-888 / DSM 13862 / ZAS-9) TaxID=545695 RepID=F5Y945_LEAAZ|nr:response regulator transcription factor [Leadbettera azotonutricia]AEF80290.1 response regulator, NarL-family [Leadbettera azotonutricia ZAS-9]